MGAVSVPANELRVVGRKIRNRPGKVKRIRARDGDMCHWCGARMDFDQIRLPTGKARGVIRQLAGGASP